MNQQSPLPPVFWLVLALAALALLVWLLVALSQQRRESGARIASLERALDESLDALRAFTAQEHANDRAEMHNTMRGMNDSIVQLMSEISRTQQQQLDSFGSQMRVNHRTDEERLSRMQQDINGRLQAYDQQMARVSQTLEDKLATNERRIADMRQTLETGMQRLQGENDKKLEQIRVTVDEKLNATLDKRLGESFRTVSERLEQVYKGLGEMQTLAVGVGDLKKVLTGVRTRGIWGEVQLAALLEQVLSPGQYEANVAVKPGSGERVEFAVCLPGKDDERRPVYLPIDAKFPIEDYRRLLDATDAGEKPAIDAAARALEAAIKVEARRIHDKYICPPDTTDFAIMFLPVEGLYGEVLRHGRIVEQLQRDFRVVITGPTTLLALLNSLQMGFRTIAIEKRSSEVWQLLGAVKTEFGKFADLLGKTQQKLQQASKSIEDAARKTRTIERRLRNVQELSQQEARGVIDLAEEAEQLALPTLAEEELPDDL